MAGIEFYWYDNRSPNMMYIAMDDVAGPSPFPLEKLFGLTNSATGMDATYHLANNAMVKHIDLVKQEF